MSGLRVLFRLLTAALLFALLFGATPAAHAQEASALSDELRVAASDLVPPPDGWETIKGPFLRVHGPPELTSTLMRLARHGATSLPELATNLQVPIGNTVHVYVSPTNEQFLQLQPGRAPTWADATAYPTLGAIYLRGPRARGGVAKPLEQVLDHELVHVLLGRAFAPKRPPQWLQEGVAQVMAGEHTPETADALARGMLGGGLLTLGEMSHGFPSDVRRAELAYAQSADFISWLQQTYGSEALPALVRELAAGAAIEGAVRKATGDFLEDVDTAWRARLSSGIPLSLTPLTGGEVWWALGGLMLLVGGVARRRQFRRRLVEMEEEERLVDELLARLRVTPHEPWRADERLGSP